MAVLAVPALVVGLVCALAVKVTSAGPVFFRQPRIGRDGQIFLIWKFRTMQAGANPVVPRVDRITRVGWWLRRASLDELPQLINVVTGDMSIVGPRPTLPYQADRWTERQQRRLAGRPGLTGLAQVRGRNDLTWAARIEHDLTYLEQQSPWLDLRIMARTVGVLASGSGVDPCSAEDPIVTVAEPAA